MHSRRVAEKGSRQGLKLVLGLVACILAASLLFRAADASTPAALGCAIVRQSVTFNSPNEVRFQLKNTSSMDISITGLDPFNYTIASSDLLDWIEWPNNTVVHNGDTASGSAIVFTPPITAKKNANVNVIMAWTGTVTPSEVQFTIQSDQGTCTIGTGRTAPVAQPDGTTTPTGISQVVHVLDNDYDLDGDPITLTRVFSTVDVPGGASVTTDQGGTATINNAGTPTEPSDDFVSYVPATSFTGPDTFSYEICDPSPLCATALVTVTVGGANTGPTAIDDPATTDEDVEVIINVAGNDTDPQNNLDPGSITVESLPSYGMAVPNGNGTLTYTPDPDISGVIDSFDYQICDTGSLCSTATVTVTIDPVNDPPTALPDSASTRQGDSVTISVLGNDFDIDSAIDPTSVVIVSPPGNGSVLVNPTTGQIRYSAGNSFLGTTQFSYQVCDQQSACSDPAIVMITVNPAKSGGGGGGALPLAPPSTPIPPVTPAPTVTIAPAATVAPTVATTVAAVTEESTSAETPPDESPVEAGEEGQPDENGTTSTNNDLEGLILRLGTDQSQATPGQIVTLMIQLENAGATAITDIAVLNHVDGPGALGGIQLALGQLQVDSEQIKWHLDQLLPSTQTVLTVELLVTGNGDNLVVCASAMGVEESADEVCATIRVSALALPQFAGDEPSNGESSSEGAAGRSASGTCLQVFGITVTCFPWIRWLLLVIVVAADVWLMWRWQRQNRQRDVA